MASGTHNTDEGVRATNVNLLQKLHAAILEDTSTTGTKFSALDGLRGIAVLVVFLSHSSGFRQRLTPWTSFHGTGHIGVYLFFVLSGFLLAWSLLGAQRVNFTAFYLRRVFRIIPLFYLVVGSVFLLQQTLGEGKPDLFNLHIKEGWRGFWQHIAFYRGDSVFWTIAAEFQFYVILPFIALMLARGGRAAAALLAAAAAFIGAWYAAIETGHADPRYSIKVAKIVHHSQYLDVFLCGILAAWFYRRPGFDGFWKKHAAMLRTVAALAAAAALAMALFLVAENFLGLGRHWRNAQPWWQAFGWPEKFGPASWSIVYGALFAAVTLAALGGVFQRVLNARWLRIIGVTGFSWYLIHFPILRLSNALLGLPPKAGVTLEWTWREPTAFACSFVLTFAAAAALYLCVEKPFMVLSRNLLKKRSV